MNKTINNLLLFFFVFTIASSCADPIEKFIGDHTLYIENNIHVKNKRNPFNFTNKTFYQRTGKTIERRYTKLTPFKLSVYKKPGTNELAGHGQFILSSSNKVSTNPREENTTIDFNADNLRVTNDTLWFEINSKASAFLTRENNNTLIGLENKFFPSTESNPSLLRAENKFAIYHTTTTQDDLIKFYENQLDSLQIVRNTLENKEHIMIIDNSKIVVEELLEKEKTTKIM